MFFYGHLSHNSKVKFKDASDEELVVINTLTEVAHVVQVPHDCDSIGILPIFKNIDSWTRGTLTDECGYSEAWIINFIYAHVWIYRLWPSGGSTEAVNSSVSGENGGNGSFKIGAFSRR